MFDRSPRDYLLEPIPSSFDDELRRAVDLFATAEPAHRGELRRTEGEEKAWHLIAFALRQSSLSVRRGDAAPLASALAGLALIPTSMDVREILQLLAVIHDAALRLRVDPTALFDGLAPLFATEVAEHVRHFPRRAADDRALSAFSFELADDPDGPRYRRTW